MRLGVLSLQFGLIIRAYKHAVTLANLWSDTDGLSGQCTISEGSQEMYIRFSFDLVERGP